MISLLHGDAFLPAFDSCVSGNTIDASTARLYLRRVVSTLQDAYPEASLLVCNLSSSASGGISATASGHVSAALKDYDITVLEYPRHYEGCPILSVDLLDHFLRTTSKWLTASRDLPAKHMAINRSEEEEKENDRGKALGLWGGRKGRVEKRRENVLLFHCEWGGWPALAFLLASFLTWHGEASSDDERKLLLNIYKAAPLNFLQQHYPINPLPSQVRYVQYVARGIGDEDLGAEFAREWQDGVQGGRKRKPVTDGAGRRVGARVSPFKSKHDAGRGGRTVILDCLIIRSIPIFDSRGGCRPVLRVFGLDPTIPECRESGLLFASAVRRPGSQPAHYGMVGDTH